MVLKAVTRLARDEVLRHMPTVPTVREGRTVTVNLDTAALVATRENALDQHLAAKDWEAIITSCPIRESGALEPISKAAGLPSRSDYEAAVRTMLTDDAETLNFVRALFGGAYATISASAH
jgi:hypothetical protein